jgi:hypothetical protein
VDACEQRQDAGRHQRKMHREWCHRGSHSWWMQCAMTTRPSTPWSLHISSAVVSMDRHADQHSDRTAGQRASGSRQHPDSRPPHGASRHRPSGGTSAESAGCCCAGFIATCYPLQFMGRQLTHLHSPPGTSGRKNSPRDHYAWRPPWRCWFPTQTADPSEISNVNVSVKRETGVAPLARKLREEREGRPGIT